MPSYAVVPLSTQCTRLTSTGLGQWPMEACLSVQLNDRPSASPNFMKQLLVGSPCCSLVIYIEKQINEVSQPPSTIASSVHLSRDHQNLASAMSFSSLATLAGVKSPQALWVLRLTGRREGERCSLSSSGATSPHQFTSSAFQMSRIHLFS